MPFLSCAFAVSSSNATRLKSFGYTRQAIKSRRGSHIACLSLLLQSAVMFSVYSLTTKCLAFNQNKRYILTEGPSEVVLFWCSGSSIEVRTLLHFYKYHSFTQVPLGSLWRDAWPTFDLGCARGSRQGYYTEKNCRTVSWQVNEAMNLLLKDSQTLVSRNSQLVVRRVLTPKKERETKQRSLLINMPHPPWDYTLHSIFLSHIRF